MSSTISRELALMIASLHGEPALLEEGMAGPVFPSELHLPNTEVLGNVTIARRTSTFVVDRTDDHKTLHVRAATALRGAGFATPDTRPRSGFASSATGEPLVFNRHDCTIFMTQGSASNGGSFVSVAVGPPMPADFYQHPARMMPELPMPMLSEPPGVRQHHEGGGGSGSSQNIRGVVITPDKSALSIAAVSAHHINDLASQSWKQIGMDVGSEHVIASYVLDQGSNKMFAGIYTISQLDNKSEARLQFVLSSLRGERGGGSWGALS